MYFKYCVTVIILIFTPNVNSKKKSSLAFVIDSTGSMQNEINAVVNRTSEVFDVVRKSDSSEIENFVLVFFKDEDSSHDAENVIVTTDENEFKEKLRNVVVFGGGDCPEASMTGIEVAIDASHHNSLMYVFTDASASDYEKYDVVLAKAFDKSIQLTFLLTGMCDNCTDCPNYRVYDKFATATGGQVFHLRKDNVTSIIDYVIDSIKTQKCGISHQHFPAMETSPHTSLHPFTVDGSIKGLTLSLVGEDPELKVYNANNILVATTTLVQFTTSHIVKMENVIAGNYKASITVSKGDANLNIKGVCTFSFQHGFSDIRPNSIQDTSKSPYTAKETFLSIKIDDDNDEFQFKSVQLKDFNNNILMEMDLHIVNRNEKFYVTDQFVPPDAKFKIAIKGVVAKTSEVIIRNAAVAVEPLKNKFAPKILEIKATKNELSDTSYSIQCLVEGFPKPVVSWKDGHGTDLESGKVVDITHSKVISKLTLDITGNIKLQCIAVNGYGSSTDSLEMLSPEIDQSITEYVKNKGENVDLVCRVIKGNPKPDISWYLSRNNEQITLDIKEETLHLSNLDLSDAGVYMCLANNSISDDSLEIDVIVQSPPQIEPREPMVSTIIGRHVLLDCVTHGIPLSSVRWFVNDTEIANGGNYQMHKNNSVSFTTQFYGTSNFRCEATNALATVSITYNVIVQSAAPIIDKVNVMDITTRGIYTIECLVRAYAKPDIVWKDQRGNKLPNGQVVKLQTDNNYKSVIQIMKPRDENITCSANNEFGGTAFNLTYPSEKPIIDKNVTKRITKKVNQSIDIICSIKQGVPKPEISWLFLGHGKKDFVTLNNSGEKVHIQKLSLSDAGRYRCKALNFKGFDRMIITVSVNMPPSIEPRERSVRSIKGDKTILDCAVSGYPSPNVRWYFQGNEIVAGGRYHIYANHSLSFYADLYDNGSFSCTAFNAAGHSSLTYDVKINRRSPISIKRPMQTVFHLLKDGSKTLDCEVIGAPKPAVEWIFRRSNSIEPDKRLTANTRNQLTLQTLKLSDAGNYTCIARDSNTVARLKYTIYIEAAPWIEDTTPANLTPVMNDASLMIICPAFGVPAPEIQWQMDDLYLGNGSYYYMESKMLIIIRIDVNSYGDYKCIAKNIHGIAEKIYTIKVLGKYTNFTYPVQYVFGCSVFMLSEENILIQFALSAKRIVLGEPKIERINETICIEEGLDYTVQCKGWENGVMSSELQWYKEGSGWQQSGGEYPQFVLKGDLTDAGIYICRGTYLRAATVYQYQVEVSVCFKPSFYNPETFLDKGRKYTIFSTLDCYATGRPDPKVSWFRNNTRIPTISMTTKPMGPGTYTCTVTNPYGEISRTYEISSSYCTLNIKRDFSDQSPILMNELGMQPTMLDVIGDAIYIPEHTIIKLQCPNSALLYDGQRHNQDHIDAICLKNSISFMDIFGQIIDLKKIRCLERSIAIVKRNKQYCSHANSWQVHVGFTLGKTHLAVYDICLNINENTPIYTRNVLRASVDEFERDYVYETSKQYDWFNYNSMFDCKRQHDDMPLDIRKKIGVGSCCFDRRQLVNPRDVFPTYESVTFNNINIAPQWSSCRSPNWIAIEQRVRAKARGNERGPLIVWTGTAQQLELNSSFTINTPISLYDVDRRAMSVPMYFWKVVEDQSISAAIAIIHLNMPNFSGDVNPYILCKDICHKRPWLNSPDWRDASKGYTYCCSVPDFLKVFSNIIFLQKMPRRVL